MNELLYSHRFEMAPGAEVFLSHNRGENKSRHNNHDQVYLINRELKQLDYQTWFDEEKMKGDLVR